MRGLLKSIYLLSLISAWAATQACAADTRPDERLKQRVTVKCVNVRLHTAVEQVAAQSRVTINTGISKNDWKVRDVPILVCAQDIPLGNLLKALADTAHLRWSGSTDDDGIVKYRLWRDRKWQEELDAYQQEKRAAQLARANYDWDVIAKMRDIPKTELEDKFPTGDGTSENDMANMRYRDLRAISNTFAEMGKQARDRILSGEPLMLTTLTAPDALKPYVTEALRTYLAKLDAAHVRNGKSAETASIDERLKNCWLMIGYDDPTAAAMGESGELVCRMWEPGCRYTIQERDFELAMDKKRNDLPARPTIPKPHFDNDELDSRYVELKLSDPQGPALLDKMVMVKKPKNKKEPSYSDLLRGLSEETGYSIVAEGRAARNVSPMLTSDLESLPSAFDRQISVREILKFPQTSLDYQDWYIDEARKIIIGRNRDWLARLDSLIPEKTITDLQEKLKGDGIGIDDLQPLMNLTPGQLDDWIYRCPEVPEIQSLHIPPPGTGLLELYFSLGTKERALLKSGKSVPLARTDPAPVKALLRKMLTNQFPRLMSMRYPGVSLESKAEGFLDKMQTLEADGTAPNMVLRLEKRDAGKLLHQYIFFLEVQGQDAIEFSDSAGFFPVRARQQGDGPERKSAG